MREVSNAAGRAAAVEVRATREAPAVAPLEAGGLGDGRRAESGLTARLAVGLNESAVEGLRPAAARGSSESRTEPTAERSTKSPAGSFLRQLWNEGFGSARRVERGGDGTEAAKPLDWSSAASSARYLPRAGGERMSEGKAAMRSLESWQQDVQRLRSSLDSRWNRRMIAEYRARQAEQKRRGGAGAGA